ncbi:MAG: hypothetical protein ACYS9X_04255 [Planctomycetota bacterium]|jgi:hypothetical protein
MKMRHFLLGLLSGVVLTVVVGGVVSLSTRRHWSAAPQYAKAAGDLTVKVVGDDDPKVVLERGGAQEVVSSPRDVVWQDLHVAGNGRHAFFMAGRKVVDRSGRIIVDDSWLVRLKLPSEGEPLSAYRIETSLSDSDLAGLLGVGEAWVDEFIGVSKDGEKVVLIVSWTDVAKSMDSHTYSSWPFIYHFSESRLERVSP